MRIGFFLSCEEHPPAELVRQAVLAERAGFEGLWISDHFHPWNDEQGHSPFVWAAIGAIAQATERMSVTTAVTCPTVRTHPAIVAHAAATCALLLDGRFALGVGSGEALNEHIVGGRWPTAGERLEMLEEAVEVIRLLWRGGVRNHRGRHYRVESARIYDLPDSPPPILVSGFGPKAVALAARIGDGYVNVAPDEEKVRAYREQGGQGPVEGAVKVCWHEDEAAARALAHRLWPNEGLPGELAQVLATPRHFEQASTLVDEDTVAEKIVCGPDVERHLEALRAYERAGFDHVYVQQVGPTSEGFFRVYEREILPALR